jgi:DNA-binding CsgD family transcriptional regulator
VVAPSFERPVATVTRLVTRGAGLRLNRRLRYGLAAVLAGITLVGVDLAQGVLPGGGAFLLLLIPVMLGAVVLGMGPALTTLLLGASGAVLLVPLRGHPWLSAPSDAARLALYLVVGGFVVAVGAVLREAIGTWLQARSARSAVSHGRLVEPLTDRELDVLRLAATGKSTDAIGRELYLSRNTVKSHLAHAYGKLGAHNRAEAIAAGLHWGCLQRSALVPPSVGAGAEPADGHGSGGRRTALVDRGTGTAG